MDGDASKSVGTDAAAIRISESMSKLEATEEKRESELDKIPMNERRRFLITVRMMLRRYFRDFFGVSFSNRWGHWLDRHMTHQISEFGYWLDYPAGHHVLKGHSDQVLAAVVSTDGRFLFTAGLGNSIIVWDLLHNSMLKQFDLSDRMITCLNYERDLLVSVGNTMKICIFNGITHDLIRSLEETHTDAVYSLQFNKECTQLVSASFDTLVKIWCVKTGECLATLTGHTNGVSSAYFMENDTRVISGSKDKSIKVWSMTDMSECNTISDGMKKGLLDMCVNCDSSLVACCFFLNPGTIYNWPKMDVVRSIGIGESRCQFHPYNPDILAVADHFSYNPTVYNVRSGDVIAKWREHQKRVQALDWTRDGYRLVSVSSDRTVRVWDCTQLEY